MTKDAMRMVDEIRNLRGGERQSVDLRDLCQIVGAPIYGAGNIRIALAYLEGAGEISVDHGGRGSPTIVHLSPRNDPDIPL